MCFYISSTHRCLEIIWLIERRGRIVLFASALLLPPEEQEDRCAPPCLLDRPDNVSRTFCWFHCNNRLFTDAPTCLVVVIEAYCLRALQPPIKLPSLLHRVTTHYKLQRLPDPHSLCILHVQCIYVQTCSHCVEQYIGNISIFYCNHDYLSTILPVCYRTAAEKRLLSCLNLDFIRICICMYPS